MEKFKSILHSIKDYISDHLLFWVYFSFSISFLKDTIREVVSNSHNWYSYFFGPMFILNLIWMFNELNKIKAKELGL